MEIKKKIAGGGHHDIFSTIFDNVICQNPNEMPYDLQENYVTQQMQKPTNTSNSKCTCNKTSNASFLRSGNFRKSEQNITKTNLPNTKNIHIHPKYICTDNSSNIFSECGFLQKYISKLVTKSSMCEKILRTESFNLKNKCTCNFILKIIKLSCIVNLFKKCSFLSLILISYILFSTIKTVNANELSPQKNLSGAQETGVCQSVDIRNNPQNLNKLSGCRVVEGFVQILLMDNYQHEAFDNYTFPDLVEITDFLLLFRVNGLQTLQKLFPNLAVIRGNSLFQNYALVIYEMVNLQEIALYSLTNITRGAVRIEKNPMLCFVNTIDWTLIARHSSKDDHYIVNNKGFCLNCGKKSNTDEKQPTDGIECPQSIDADKKRLCWNLQNCQNVCPPQCGNRACNKNHECCDETCIGGCTNDNVKNCTVCRDYSYLDGAHRVCTVGCPNGTFIHMNRRCITEDECRKIKKPLVFRDEQPSFPYIPFNGVCTLECPVGHYEIESNNLRWCKKCEAGRCKKVCGAANIDSIQSAQKLRGCTHIDGSLEIQIRSQGGLNIVRELEQSLSGIEEIDGYLKVVRSFPLLSLSFLKRLRRITGKTTDSQQRSLVIMDNQNLQDLWEENQEVRVDSGLLFFYFNPKLCFYKISNFINKNTKGVDDHTLSTFRSTNGEKTACNVTLLEVRVNKPSDSNSANSVILSWDALEIDDDRTLLGYVVFYIVAPFQNVTMYDGRDACGGDGWHVDDVGNSGAPIIFHLVAHLEPYTQYAYYVKTYTLSTEKNGAQSSIQYFTTSPGEPEKVQKITAIANSSSEIVVYWEPPKKVNGKLASFIIKCTLSNDDSQLYGQRDYCAEPITHKDMTKYPDPERIPKPTVDAPKECDCSQCPANNPPRTFEESEAEQQINFEDHLHNYVYVKKNSPANPQTRIKRETKQGNESIIASTDIFFPSMSDESNSSKSNLDETTSIKNNNGQYTYIYKEVNASVRSFVLRELIHYSFYNIEVKACREGPGPDNCSTNALYNQRTQKIPNSDDIRTFNVMVEQTNNSLGAARIIWASPDRPNGIIISYTIKYKKVIQDSKANIICITSKQFAIISGSYLLTGLDQGNYSIQIMASSLAGDGNYTPPRYIFIQEEDSIMIPVLISFAVFLLIAFVCAFIWYRRKDQSMRANMKLIASVNPEYVSMTYQPDEWEVPRENIIQLQELGQGSFGMVYQGIVKNLSKPDEESRCAIKTVNENATDRERINFLKEASVMKAFKTHHVVQLLGVVSSGQPTLVIMELMPNGDLKGYLRSHRPNADVENGSDIPPQPPTLKRILQMAIEIADGMAYLAAKKFVHRDLAARNCMVAEDLTVKIGDFGMTRDIYETDYYRKGTKGLLPVRWMSPESLKDGVFTSFSDVFSFGVVLWEMATLASQPYQGLSNDQVLRYVIDGGVMERPENCPDKLYDLMRQCWQHRPSARPSFLDIVSMLFSDAHPSFVKVSFYHSSEGQELLTQISQIQKPDETQPLRLDTDDDHDDMMDDSYLDRTNAHLIDENQTRIRPSADSLR